MSVAERTKFIHKSYVEQRVMYLDIDDRMQTKHSRIGKIYNRRVFEGIEYIACG